MAYDPNNDPEFDAYTAQMDAADSAKTQAQLAKDIGERREQTENPIRSFVTNLPKNIGIGAYKAFVNTIDTAEDVTRAISPGVQSARIVGGEEMERAMYPKLADAYPETMKSIHDFTSEWERNDNLGADITQGVAQFTLPFMGWLKGLQGVGGAGKLGKVVRGAGAEAAAVGTAFDPHDGRVADLLEMGRESESRFGTLMRKVSPDGSLSNAYIDYMTNRDDEGVAEGRFKNVVDALATSAGLAGIIKSAAGAKKLGVSMLEDFGKGGGPGGRYQKGMVNFHGTPHDFDAFSLDKLGSGEGAQTFGHGLYFAEEKGVAERYRAKLTGQDKFRAGSPMDVATKTMQNVNWNSQQAYKHLANTANQLDRLDPALARTYREAAEKIRGGNVKQLGKLMTVDIDDAAVSKMLDYDKPLAEQPDILKKIPPKDRAALEEMLDENDITEGLEGFTGNELQQMIGRAIDEDRLAFAMPNDEYSGNLRQYAAEYFKAHDIPGIRYLDAASRGAGDGTRNIVLFDDSLVKILKKE